MQAMICELCGGNDFAKQDGFFVCQHCGTKYSIEEAKKLFVEVTGNVKVDNKEKLNNYYTLARRARDNNNAPDAAKYYDLIRAENPDDWEASFFSVYYQAMQSRIMTVKAYTDMLINATVTSTSIAAVKLDQSQAISAINLMLLYVNVFSESVFETCEKGYNDSWPNVSSEYTEAHITRIYNLYTKLVYLGNGCYNAFRDKPALQKLCIIPYKEAIKIGSNFDIVWKKRNPNVSQYEVLKEVFDSIPKVKEFEPSYVAPYFPSTQQTNNTGSKGGCYVATAVYGSYDCPEVWTLRRFRDEMLAETWYGRAFIRIYYALSPTLVKWFGKKIWFKNLWKPTLDKMVLKFNKAGLKDTPYQDKQW